MLMHKIGTVRGWAKESSVRCKERVYYGAMEGECCSWTQRLMDVYANIGVLYIGFFEPDGSHVWAGEEHLNSYQNSNGK